MPKGIQAQHKISLKIWEEYKITPVEMNANIYVCRRWHLSIRFMVTQSLTPYFSPELGYSGPTPLVDRPTDKVDFVGVSLAQEQRFMAILGERARDMSLFLRMLGPAKGVLCYCVCQCFAALSPSSFNLPSVLRDRFPSSVDEITRVARLLYYTYPCGSLATLGSSHAVCMTMIVSEVP